MKELIVQLQDWFLRHCDGEWEHQEGVRIETLDNPGWLVGIDISETELAFAPFEAISIERSEDDWVFAKRESAFWQCACGPENLAEAVQLFLTWAERRPPNEAE